MECIFRTLFILFVIYCLLSFAHLATEDMAVREQATIASQAELSCVYSSDIFPRAKCVRWTRGASLSRRRTWSCYLLGYFQQHCKSCTLKGPKSLCCLHFMTSRPSRWDTKSYEGFQRIGIGCSVAGDRSLKGVAGALHQAGGENTANPNPKKIEACNKNVI